MSRVYYGIVSAGDAQGGSRDEIHIVSEEQALVHVNDSWSYAAKITAEPLEANPSKIVKDWQTAYPELVKLFPKLADS